jgi:3-methyladenine DNA glycosylase Mpg
MLLNLDEAPKDPIERLMYLSGVKEQVNRELEDELAEAYFQARLQRRFEAALAAGPYKLKRALALTRHENQKRGRSIRWNDGLDSTSSAYQRR